MTTQTYEGWKNRATWNCALWINNEYPMYIKACEFMRMYKGREPYRDYIRWLSIEEDRTPDGFKWLGTRLSYKELNDMMREMLT
jgi:hypothetical protein